MYNKVSYYYSSSHHKGSFHENEFMYLKSNYLKREFLISHFDKPDLHVFRLSPAIRNWLYTNTLVLNNVLVFCFYIFDYQYKFENKEIEVIVPIMENANIICLFNPSTVKIFDSPRFMSKTYPNCRAFNSYLVPIKQMPDLPLLGSKNIHGDDFDDLTNTTFHMISELYRGNMSLICPLMVETEDSIFQSGFIGGIIPEKMSNSLLSIENNIILGLKDEFYFLFKDAKVSESISYLHNARGTFNRNISGMYEQVLDSIPYNVTNGELDNLTFINSSNEECAIIFSVFVIKTHMDIFTNIFISAIQDRIDELRESNISHYNTHIATQHPQRLADYSPTSNNPNANKYGHYQRLTNPDFDLAGFRNNMEDERAAFNEPLVEQADVYHPDLVLPELRTLTRRRRGRNKNRTYPRAVVSDFSNVQKMPAKGAIPTAVATQIVAEPYYPPNNDHNGLWYGGNGGKNTRRKRRSRRKRKN